MPSSSSCTSKNSDRPSLRTAAYDIEQLVIAELKAYFTDHKRLVEHFSLGDMTPTKLKSVLTQAKALASAVEKGAPAETRTILMQIVERVVSMPDTVRIELKRYGLLNRLAIATADDGECDAHDELILLEVSTSFARHGVETKLIVSNTTDVNRSVDPALLKAVARGHFWFEELVSGRATSITELGKSEGVTDRYVSQLINLAFLPPSMVERIVEGRQPLHISRSGMAGTVPLLWPTEATGRHKEI